MSIRYIDYANELIPVVALGNEELIPLPYVYGFLGVSRQDVYKVLDSLTTAGYQIPAEIARQIRQQEGSGLGGRPPHGITKDQFRKLVKVVGTPEAWNVYGAIWGMAENHAHAIQNDMPEWAAYMKNSIDERFNRIEDVCGGLRREVDELKAMVGFVYNEKDEEEVQVLVKRVKDELGIDGRAVVGHVGKILNRCSIYDSPDMRAVKNVLRNMLGEGVRLVKDETDSE